jgi:CBS domain containing-hemolysin-like protein
LFYPVSKLALWVSNFFLRLFFGQSAARHNDEEKVFTRVDLNHFVTQSDQNGEGIESQSNFRIFRNALDFSNMRVRECMVPRTEIEAVEIKSGIDRLRSKFTETRFSRILVYQDSIDHITGYFELKDLFKNPVDIESGMRKIAIVPETMQASRLLKVFVEEKKNIAVVVDEFGGTSGMVTIEDVVEEIVGDIEDEHDTNELVEKVTGENQYVLSGRLEIDYLNDKYGINLPEEDEFETLAGMVMYYHGSIPGQNDSIRIGNITVKVLKVSATRIDLISLRVEQ